ncbi:unnamed protein product [Medioppia subpectinata]|uniref:Probable ATP-dependent RNA helicase DDX52 n=1 Tax=Medioppia subpectinata TaxID=1979941 RepID=A0A7R9Q015_9ACAR|nr:unnamed protein product [Medioppia subpectinata]CAG2107613.1 unnamed protein product [Medioppia subpectinata]
MSGDDVFRKLISGSRFNYKKFGSDVKKFSINKSHDDQSCVQSGDDIPPVDETIGGQTHNGSDKPKKKSSAPKSRKQLIELNTERVNQLRNKYRIHVKGSDVNEPIVSFDELNVDQNIMENIRKSGFGSPTAVQMQSIPLLMSKREMLCCAPTGSGKTLAFLIPIVHQLRGPQRKGFRAVILAPTRELAKQIHRECLWISNGTGLRVHIIKNVNLAQKKFGPNSELMYDILVTTPNRLVYLLSQEPVAINIENVEWLVIDECDKLFEEGFRDQLSVIFQSCGKSTKVSHAMFSATHDIELEKWAKLNLDNLVAVGIGGKNNASQEVDQTLTFVGNESGKIMALRDVIARGCEAPVLIFVDKIQKAKQLHKELVYDGINIDVIHSKRTQQDRDNVVRSFREGKVWFLICTDLMGRGIDFKGVNLVINYDFPSTSVSYIHKIGRTGRAGRKGKAITFFTEKDSDKLRSIANVMRRSGCDVPQFMLELNKRKRKFFNNKRKQNNKSKDKKSKKLKADESDDNDIESD